MNTTKSSSQQNSFWYQHLERFLRILAPLYGLLIISTVLDQAISGQVEEMLRSPHGTPSSIWIFASISLIVSVFFPLLQTLVVGFSLRHSPSSHVQVQDYMGENFPQLLIEELRAWGQCLFFSLLFILPGLYRLLQLLFVPFVVLFDPKYASGEVDALQQSRLIFSKYWAQTLTLVVIFYLVLPLLMTTLFEAYRNYFAHPLTALGLNFIEAILTYSAIVWLFKIYSKSQVATKSSAQETADGTHV